MKSGDKTKQRDTLRRLQSIAAPLESDSTSRDSRVAEVGAHAEFFLQNLQAKNVYVGAADRFESMEAMRLSDKPASLQQALGILHEHVDTVGHNIGSSRFFAYIPSGGLHISALGDYLAAVTNRYAGVGNASPGAARMDETLLRFLANMIGYPETADGDLTSGGSIAALSAVVTAREAYGIRSRTVEDHVVYLTTQTHHTFRKALHVAGLGDCKIQKVPLDDRYRMNADALSDFVAADRADGLTPWLVAASAGTTDIGAVDPLDKIADIADKEQLWFHIDAAYGGAFTICEEGRRRLHGIARSDSLILDPHKGFFLPHGVGAVLVRDGQKLFDAYHARGAYMQDIAHDDERSACDRSPELSRPFRALRFWLPFKVLGTAPFEAALEEKLLLAQYAFEKLSALDDIETGPSPDLSIVTFRYLPPSGDANEANRRLVDAIQNDGRVLMSSTTIDGKVMIRLAVLGYNTHLDEIDTALQVIGEKLTHLQQD